VPDLKGNFPLAIGESGSRVAVAFRSPATLVLLDPKSGTVTASFPSCSDADDVFFDAERRRIYVSCGEGTVAVFQADSAGASFLASVRTSPGARTSLFVPELDRLFVAVPASRSRADASVLVFRPVP
jgi:hypothetical protein